MSLHSDTLFSFRANQSLLFLLNGACLAEEATNTNFAVFDLTQPGLELTIYRTPGEHANHYATDVVIYNKYNECYMYKINTVPILNNYFPKNS